MDGQRTARSLRHLDPGRGNRNAIAAATPNTTERHAQRYAGVASYTVQNRGGPANFRTLEGACVPGLGQAPGGKLGGLDPNHRTGPALVSDAQGAAVDKLASLQLCMGRPTQAELDWLQTQCVSREALAMPWPIGACTARIEGRTFELDAGGERVITIVITDGDETVDVAAWAPRSGKLASYLRTAFAIGQDAIFNPATYAFGNALHVHRTPLDWLCAGRRGIVILRSDLCHAYLAQRERLAFEDEVFARQVKRWIQPPTPRARILVSKRAEPAQACEVPA